MAATISETVPGSVDDLDLTVELAIGGMTCAACVGRVERKLGKLAGVRAAVNLATERAVVSAPSSMSPERLVETVRNAGYSARVVTSDDDPTLDTGEDVRASRRRLAVALVLFVPLADLSLAMSLVPSLRFPFWEVVVAVLALPVVGWAAWPIHRTAMVNLRHGATSMDTLVSLGVLAASAWSVVGLVTTAGRPATESGWQAVLHPGGPLYLEVAAGVTTFVLAGRYFETRACRRAGGVMRSLALLRPDEVGLLDEGRERRVPAVLLRAGDRFVVRPGERIAVDGTVESGAAAVDTSAMTGEPVPVDVGAGDGVVGGTIATAGRLVVRADTVGADTRLGRMIAAVERAQVEKSATQRLVDKVSSVFVPVVLVASVGTLVAWLLAGGGVEHALAAAVAVVIIACPCALGLATPTALMVAAGRGAELGIFVKGHRALEAVRAVDTVVLDKTGTLTEGVMRVVELAPAADVDEARLLTLAGAVESASEHPIARAVSEYAIMRVGPLPEPEEFTSMPGRGARGTVGGVEVTVGRLVDVADVPTWAGERAAELEGAGYTVVAVSTGGEVAGLIALDDPVHGASASAVAGLKARGLRPILLTGDSGATAAAVAAAVGIDAADVHARALPDDKAAFVARLQGQGRRIAMVGDGVNDAAALTVADLGIAIGTGADVALEAADLVLVRNDLRALLSAVDLARATLSTIRGNLAWACAYNVAAVPLAALGLLNPLIAGAAMAVSSLLVVTNSLRLRNAARH